MAQSSKTLMDSESIRRALTRVAHEILEKNKGSQGLALIGIKDRGDVLAERLGEAVEAIEGQKLPVGAVDISFYRDDFGQGGPKRAPRPTEIDFSVDDQTVVLVDDVLFTGRSTRAALDALTDLGRPRRVWLAVLVDRGHRELPISADFVGKSIPTSEREAVSVRVKPTDSKEGVFLAARAAQ